MTEYQISIVIILRIRILYLITCFGHYSLMHYVSKPTSVALTRLQNIVSFCLAVIIISAMFCIMLLEFGAVVTALYCALKNLVATKANWN